MTPLPRHIEPLSRRGAAQVMLESTQRKGSKINASDIQATPRPTAPAIDCFSCPRSEPALES
jgi:hypothetical protein